MNRRGFLARLLGVGVVAATDPSTLLTAPSEAPPALSEATVAASGRLVGLDSSPIRDALPKFNAESKGSPE